MLVELKIIGYECIAPWEVEEVVNSCPRLRVLDANFTPGDFALKSSSLERIGIYNGATVTLDTPALTDLCIIFCEKLDIRSHALKKLELEIYSDIPFIPIRVSPILANLERLSFEGNFEPGKMEQVLMAIIPGGCVDVLRVGMTEIPKYTSSILATCMEPLARVKKLEIDSDFMDALAMNANSEQGSGLALTKLGVEELVVEVRARTYDDDEDKIIKVEKYCRHFSGTILQLSSSIRKLVIDYSFFPSVDKPTLTSCRKVLETGVECLKDKYPGIISERYVA